MLFRPLRVVNLLSFVPPSDTPCFGELLCMTRKHSPVVPHFMLDAFCSY